MPTPIPGPGAGGSGPPQPTGPSQPSKPTPAAFWYKVKSNPIFVTVSSAMGGAVASAIQDELASGKLDWSHAGLSKLFGFAASAGIAALVHLYRNPPRPTILAVTPPSPDIKEVAAVTTPANPADKAVPQ